MWSLIYSTNSPVINTRPLYLSSLLECITFVIIMAEMSYAYFSLFYYVIHKTQLFYQLFNSFTHKEYSTYYPCTQDDHSNSLTVF